LKSAVECLGRLHELGVCLLHLGRLVVVRQVLRVGGAVLRQRAGQRRLLLLVRVLLLLIVELNEHLPGPDAVAKVGKNRANLPVSLGRDGDLIDGSEGTDDVDGAMDRVLTHEFHLDGFRRPFAAARLGGICFRTRGEWEQEEGDGKSSDLPWTPAHTGTK
jgi:hypothetical protein